MNATNEIRIIDQDVATIGRIAGALKRSRNRDVSPSEAVSFVLRSLKGAFVEQDESKTLQRITDAVDRLESRNVSSSDL
jgi:hypothetical protein